MRFMMEHSEINGLFNLGTGKARSFYDLAGAVFDAMGLARRIRFVEMPEALRGKYQYFTEAKMDKLREAGYQDAFYSLEDGVLEYVREYLGKGFEVY